MGASMKSILAEWSVTILCLSIAGASGGSLFEHTGVIPIWCKWPPSSFAIIQPGSGVPLQFQGMWVGIFKMIQRSTG